MQSTERQTAPPLSSSLLFTPQSNTVKFVPCLSVNVHVKTFIMTMTNNNDEDDDDEYNQLGHVKIPTLTPPPHSLLVYRQV